MEGKPQGITYSKQMTTTARPVQQGTAIGGNAGSPQNTLPTAASTVTPSSTGTTYLTISRGLLIAGLLFSLASPAFISVEAYLFMGPMLAPTLIALILTLFVNRGWSYITSTILGVLFPFLFLVMFAGHEQGFNPLNSGAYAATVFNVAAIPFILTGGIGGFRNTRGKTGVSFGSGFRTVPGVFALLMCALLVGALATSYAANANALAETSGGFDAQPNAATSTVMQDFAFTPKILNVPLTSFTEITIENRDPSVHTFTYKNGGQEYNHELLPGQTTSIIVFFSTAGTYNFWCVPHSNGAEDQAEDSMVGQIIVA